MKKRIFIYTIILTLFGLLMIYSSSSIISLYKYGNSYRYVLLQGSFFIIGLICLIIFSKIDYNLYKKYSNVFLLISFILLILVLIPGIGKVRNGSRSWFCIGEFGIQPSEFTKLGLIIFTYKYLTKNNKELKDIKKGVMPILIVLFSVFNFLFILSRT